MGADKPTSKRIGDDCLLGIEDVAEILGVSRQVASKVIRETGKRIVIRRRVFILESSFLAYLKEQEAGGGLASRAKEDSGLVNRDD